MERLAIRVRAREARELEPLPPQTLPEQAPEATPRELGSSEFVLDVKAAGAALPDGKYDVPALVTASVVGLVTAVALFQLGWIALSGLPGSIGGGCLIHLLFGRPVFRLVRMLRAESHRLRTALTCPYCHDKLPDDAAMVCDRDGCGAYYHEECWEECRRDYGGCAIYGCGTAKAHAVGRFAIQRRILRLLIAAALFPPNLVKRLRDSERESFRQVWQRSRSYQQGISADPARTLFVGFLNLVVTCGATIAVVVTLDPKPGQALLWAAIICPVVFLFMRLPLLTHFTWAGSRLLARVFRDELAALSRADEGTFLARLGAGLGKKD